MTIKELILKDNMVIPGYPVKFYNGLSVLITSRTKCVTKVDKIGDGNVVKECFVSGIKHYSKNSDFAKNHGLPSGCYVVSITENSKGYCMGNNDDGPTILSKESYMIEEINTMKKQKWLVTVIGFSNYYNPPDTTTSVVIELKKGVTPIDWFQTGPKVYNRFEFVPDALLNFWPIEEKKGKKE